MAYDKKQTSYDVKPVEENGKLIALAIRREVRMVRMSDNGKVLDRGWLKANIEEIAEIPIGKIPDLVRELVDWTVWFAQGKDEEEN